MVVKLVVTWMLSFIGFDHDDEIRRDNKTLRKYINEEVPCMATREESK